MHRCWHQATHLFALLTRLRDCNAKTRGSEESRDGGFFASIKSHTPRYSRSLTSFCQEVTESAKHRYTPRSRRLPCQWEWGLTEVNASNRFGHAV